MTKADLGTRVLGLLAHERVDLRCAAALVVGTVGKGDARVAKGVARLLGDADQTVRRFALEALETLGARGLVAELVPLLGHHDDDVRARAAHMLAVEAGGAERALAAAVADEHGPAAARRAAVGLLAKLHGQAAQNALLSLMGDHDIGEHALQALRAELEREPKLANPLEGRAQKALGKLEKVKQPDEDTRRRQGNLLRLLGYVAHPATLPLLVRYTGQKLPLGLRVAAIAAMRRILAALEGVKKTDFAIDALIQLADDADPQIARAAVDTLRGARIPEAMAKKFTALSSGRNPEAQKLALERLPALGAKAAIPRLIDALAGADPGPRDAAARALAAAPEAAGALAAALADAPEGDEQYARRLAAALRGHEVQVPAKAAAALAARAARAADGETDRAGAVALDALSRVAADRHAELLFARAGRLRKAGRLHEAFAALRPLLHTGAATRLDDEQRFFVAVLGLKAGGKDLLRAARTVDPVLVQFRQLAGGGYPVARSLAKQKDVAPDDLFTLGFNLIESAEDDEKDLGRELLEAVIARQPRGKLATAARNKLKLSR